MNGVDAWAGASVGWRHRVFIAETSANRPVCLAAPAKIPSTRSTLAPEHFYTCTLFLAMQIWWRYDVSSIRPLPHPAFKTAFKTRPNHSITRSPQSHSLKGHVSSLTVVTCHGITWLTLLYLIRLRSCQYFWLACEKLKEFSYPTSHMLYIAYYSGPWPIDVINGV
jgi:hypothetical protein